MLVETGTIEHRFFSKVEIRESSECWWWTAASNNEGYGLFWACRQVRAHRWAYERWIGPIQDGLQIDHLCRNTLCVRPSHLEAVTGRVNTLRGVGPTAQNARKTKCPQEHPLAGGNLYTDRDGWRRCRLCHNERSKERYRRAIATQGRVAS